MNLKNNDILEKAFWFSLYCLAFLFTFSNLAGKIFIIIAFIIWIFQGKYKHIKNEYFFFLLIFSAYYSINFIGIIHSDNVATSLTRLESRLHYLIFPLIIFTTPYQQKRYHTIFWCFTISILCLSLASIYCAIRNVWPIATSISLDDLSYVRLTNPLGLHPTYLGLCVSIAIFFVISNVKNSLSLGKIAICVTIIIYLTAFLFLLLSRGVIIPFIIAITFSGLMFLFKSKSKKTIIILCGLLAVAFCSILFVDIMRQRFIAPFQSERTAITTDNQEESVALHLKSWACAVELLSNSHFFTGYGSGDEKDVLAECYKSHGWSVMVQERYNAHNEYLSCLLRNGIIEALLLILSLGTALYWGLRTRNLFYISFSIVYILSLLFTTLNDFSAIVALNFFNALLFVTVKNTDQLESKTLK
jgi:O-antigen ligase